MTRGSVIKLVTTFGSRWGRIRPDGDTREVFFNTASLLEPEDFPLIVLGGRVEFDDRPDFVTGGHAANMVLTPAAAETS